MLKSFSFVCVFATVVSVQSAQANGVRSGDQTAALIAQHLGHSSIVCESSTDRVVIDVDRAGTLRMVASYSGSISGTLDTDNEGSGEECGGLSVKLTSSSADFILDDSYNDCERGDWGYRVLLPVAALSAAAVQFSTHSYAMLQDTTDGAARLLSCTRR